MKLELSEADRKHLSDTQAIGLDSEGREILIGLSREESEWLLRDKELWVANRNSGTPTDEARSIELEEKHDVARLQGVGLASAKPAGNA